MTRSSLIIGGLVAVAIVVRLLALDFVTDDLRIWVIPWYDYVAEHGFRALGQAFPNAHNDIRGNYSPPYYYALWAVSRFAQLAPRLYLIKLVSIAFDAVAAFAMFRLVRWVNPTGHVPWFAAITVLLAPTIVANGALWGQCDIIPASVLLACVYASIRGKPALTVALFGIALSIKATAVFLAPYILMLALVQVVPWRYLLIVPFSYFAMIAPAWLLGRRLQDVAMVYLQQGGLYHELSMDAANLYFFAPGRFYDQGIVLGVGITLACSVVFALLPRLRRVSITPSFLMFAATLSVTFAPFTLPKMHDRYFMSADLMSIGLAFVSPRLWFVPVTIQFASALAYVPILSDSITGSGGYRGLTPLAVALNSSVIVVMAWIYARTNSPKLVGESAAATRGAAKA